MGLVALPVMLLGIYQFFQPTSSWVNQYVADTANISTVAGRPRITGTFAYMNGMSAFMIFNTILGFAVAVAGFLTKRRLLTWGGAIFFGVCLVVLPMIGSRGPVLILGILIAGIGLLLLGQKRGGTALVLSVILVGGLVFGITAQTNLDEGWMALQDRVETAHDDPSKRTINTLLGPLNGLKRAGILGYGVGTFHQGAPRLVSGNQGRSWIPGGYVENGVMRLVLELGGIGWLVLFGLKCFVAWMAYQVFRAANSAFEVVVGIVGVGKGITHILLPVIFTNMAAITYWTVVGFVIYTWSYQQVRTDAVPPQKTPVEAATATR
ncbi:hypothetical protein [Salinibacter sp. 10B]|uniref:O-antigen ligase family protein n=1 Tax=Salinibacter sp. 10B TaxID=1923971 RepID=UPI001C612130|nr:hypothetical protein [Salinibacter sp. 10B]